jgi:hypothetical protein
MPVLGALRWFRQTLLYATVRDAPEHASGAVAGSRRSHRLLGLFQHISPVDGAPVPGRVLSAFDRYRVPPLRDRHRALSCGRVTHTKQRRDRDQRPRHPECFRYDAGRGAWAAPQDTGGRHCRGASFGRRLRVPTRTCRPVSDRSAAGDTGAVSSRAACVSRLFRTASKKRWNRSSWPMCNRVRRREPTDGLATITCTSWAIGIIRIGMVRRPAYLPVPDQGPQPGDPPPLLAAE